MPHIKTMNIAMVCGHVRSQWCASTIAHIMQYIYKPYHIYMHPLSRQNNHTHTCKPPTTHVYMYIYKMITNTITTRSIDYICMYMCICTHTARICRSKRSAELEEENRREEEMACNSDTRPDIELLSAQKKGR